MRKIIPCVLFVVFAAGLFAGAVSAQNMLSGRVYEGQKGVEVPPLGDSKPLVGVTVNLYGADDPDQMGTYITHTTSDGDGWYGLEFSARVHAYEYYNIVSMTPASYTREGATSVSGTVRAKDWIQYEYDQLAETTTGNKFWHKPITIPENQPPHVFAGDDMVKWMPLPPPFPVGLAGEVVDDGLPHGEPLVIEWSLLSGPGEVVIEDAANPETTAHFHAYGGYVLRLVAFDGEFHASDEVAIEIREPVVVCPEHLVGIDIGEALPPGSHEPCPWPICGDGVAVTAGGADIWGTADQFYFAYADIEDLPGGDFTLIARVRRIEPPDTDGWAKAGVMVRETLEPGSCHAMIVRTPSNGIALQGRDGQDGRSWRVPIGGGYGPDDDVWVRLDLVGNTVTGAYAIGGEAAPTVWMAVASREGGGGGTRLLMALASHEIGSSLDAGSVQRFYGLATTSHEQGTPVLVQYADFCVGPYAGPAVIVEPELPDSAAGSPGYMGIREVIDNNDINHQTACYASLGSGRGTIVDYTASVLNIQDSGGNGHYGNDDLFGVVTAGYRGHGAVEHISLIARGIVHIPPGQDGFWTFGVNSDDGCTLQLPGHDFVSVTNGELVHFEKGTGIRFYGGRSAADTLGVIELLPGDYPFWLTYHETGGDASVELFAAKGAHDAFDPDAFRLVGSPGGLQLVAVRLVGDITGDGFVSCADFNIMAGEWLARDDLVTDLHPDGKVDFKDFGVFADYWKKYVAVGLSSPAPVNSNAGTDSADDEEPRVATDGKGNWVVVWQSSGGFGSDSDILFSRSVNDGQSWSPVAPLNSNASSDSAEDKWPRVAADGKGNWLVVWQSSGFAGTDPDILFSRSGDNGNSWSTVAALNLNAASDASIDIYPALAADGKGNWVVVWEGPGPGLSGYDLEIVYSHSGDHGKTWTYPAALNNYAGSDSAADLTPDIACDGSTWMTVWSSNYDTGSIGTDSDILFSLSTTNGKVWGPAKAVNSDAGTDSAGDSFPEIAKGTGWNWVVTWQSSSPSYGLDPDIFLAQTQDGGLSWYAPELANDYGKSDHANDTEPCIASDGTGAMVAVWTTGGDPNWTIGTDVDALFSYSKDDGRTWSKAQPLNLTATLDSAKDWYPDVAGDGKGTWLAVWYSDNPIGGTGTDYDIFVTRFTLP